ASKAIKLDEAKKAMEDTQMLADDIHAILAILLSDNRDAQLKAERERIEKLLKFLDQTIRNQKVTRAQPESNRLDKKSLVKTQKKVPGDTKALARAMSKDGKGDSKSPPGQPKDGQPKNGKSGDSKGQGQPKDGQPKD